MNKRYDLTTDSFEISQVIAFDKGKGDLPIKNRMNADSDFVIHATLSKQDRQILNRIEKKLDKLLGGD